MKDEDQYEVADLEECKKFEEKRDYKIPKTLKELIDEELERDRQANQR